MAVADVHEQRGGTDSALALLYTIDEACPEFNGVQARIARVRSIRNEHAAAIAILKRGIRFHPDDSKLYAMLGKEYALTKEYESAVDAYQMAVKYGRESELDALLQIGNIYYENLMNSRKARSYYARYVKAGGKDGLALSMAREKE
jgi:tetratricopeptide (TPR) repeat protein